MRVKSCSVTMPTRRPSSTTGRAPTPRSFINWIASTERVDGAIVTTSVFIASRTESNSSSSRPLSATNLMIVR